MASKPKLRSMTDTVPPQDLAAERSLLGAMMYDREAPARALGLLDASDFYHPQHEFLFGVMARLVSEGKPLDNITVAAELERTDKLEWIGGHTFLAELGEATATSAHIEHHAQIIAECAEYRRLMRVCTQGSNRALHRAGEVQELLAETFDGLCKVKRPDGRAGLVPVSQCITGDVSRIETWQTGTATPRTIALGFPKTDDLSGGMLPGEVTIVAAKTSVGKSSFALQVATFAALRGQRVAVFSLEMSQLAVRLRILSQLTGIPVRRMRETNGLTGDDLSRIHEARERLAQVNLAICDQAGLTVSRLRLELQRAYAFDPPDLVVVDYLQIVAPEKTSGDNRNNQVAGISAGLKLVAKDFDCAVLALSQLNRSNVDGRPQLSGLRDSGALEQDGALVIGLYRPLKNGIMGEEAEAIVLKNRYEQLGRVSLRWSGARFTFAELEAGETIWIA